MPLSVVGWNWTNSMSASGAPARYASAMPSPVLITAFVLVRKTRPLPPVAKMTALAPIACNPPWIRSHATTPRQTPSSTINAVTYHSSYTAMRRLSSCSYMAWRMAWPVRSAA